MNESAVWLMVGLLFLGVYFFPSFVGKARGVKTFAGVLVLNFFLGWTFIGWVGALIWAVSGSTEGKTAP